MRTLLKIQGLKKYFPVTGSHLFSRTNQWIRALDGIDFTIKEGETFSLVGESGCGKTTTIKIILLLEKPTSGSILFEGKNVTELKGTELKRYRVSVKAVFQDPFSSLNPRMHIGTSISEPLRVNYALSKTDVRARVEEALNEVGLAHQSVDLYPHEFSGGQRQRIAIARALVTRPRLVILDEPVSALDVSIRSQVMNLLKDLQERFGLSYLLVAHNLGTVRYMSHRVAVVYLGKIVEIADSEELFTHTLHPYTQALISAALPLYPDMVREEIILPGEVPNPDNPPPGCRFHPRCFSAKPVCSEVEPGLKAVGSGHQVACHHY